MTIEQKKKNNGHSLQASDWLGRDIQDGRSFGRLRRFPGLTPAYECKSNTTAGGNEVALLQADETGAMIFLNMNKGDTVNLNVNANYEPSSSGCSVGHPEAEISMDL